MEQVDDPPFDSLVLVSDDAIFTTRVQVLGEELLRETGASLRVERKIEDVEFPGEYDEGEFDLNDALIEDYQIVDEIRSLLPERDVSRFLDDFADGASVRAVAEVDLLENSIEVRRRYATGAYEVSAEAIATVEVTVFAVWEGDEGEDDYAERSEWWRVRVQWRGESTDGSARFDGDYSMGVIDRDYPTDDSPA